MASLALAVLAAPHAHAKPAASGEPSSHDADPAMAAVIEVERAPGSEACPDSESVFRSIARLFPERAFRRSTDVYTSAASARVRIRPLESGHEAVVSALLPRRGQRVILEKDQDCQGLADALALAFVMLVQPSDSKSAPTENSPVSLSAEDTTPVQPAPCNPESKSEATREPQIVPTPVATTAASFEPRQPLGTRRLRAEAAASSIGGFGILNEPALGAAAGVELYDQSGWGFTLQGVRLWSRPAEAQGGSVTLTLWGLLVGPCYRARLGAVSSLDGCLRLGIGSEYAAVKQFLTPQSGNFPWLTLTPTLGYRFGFTQSLTAFVRIGPTGQLRPQSFSVRSGDGTGATSQIAAAPGVGVLAEFGLDVGGEFLLTRFDPGR